MNDRINFYVTCEKSQSGMLFDALAEVGNPIAEVYSSKFDDKVFEATVRLDVPVVDVGKLRNVLQARFHKCVFY